MKKYALYCKVFHLFLFSFILLRQRACVVTYAKMSENKRDVNFDLGNFADPLKRLKNRKIKDGFN